MLIDSESLKVTAFEAELSLKTRLWSELGCPPCTVFGPALTARAICNFSRSTLIPLHTFPGENSLGFKASEVNRNVNGHFVWCSHYNMKRLLWALPASMKGTNVQGGRGKDVVVGERGGAVVVVVARGGRRCTACFSLREDRLLYSVHPSHHPSRPGPRLSFQFFVCSTIPLSPASDFLFRSSAQNFINSTMFKVSLYYSQDAVPRLR